MATSKFSIPEGPGNNIASHDISEDGVTKKLQRVVVANPSGQDVATGVGLTVADGRKTVASAGTAETLAASTSCRSLVITAETDNTGVIVVGGSTVVAALATRRGTPLNAGDSIAIDIDNLADVYLDTTVNGDGVTYTYTT